MEQVEKCIIHTFDLLFEFQKWEDLQNLLDPMCSMLSSFRRSADDVKTANDTNKNSGNLNKNSSSNLVPNLPLEYTITTLYILQAISSLK
jgi:hypothetical protein